MCDCVISSVFAVKMRDAYALRKQRFAVFEAAKAIVVVFFSALFLSIIHHQRHRLLVIKALLLEGSI